jgi:rRNA maturation endonuclease Nob1
MAFARQTGDFSALSLTDIKVLALTYMLDKEAHGGSTEHLRTEPRSKTGTNGAVVMVSGKVVSGGSKPVEKKDTEEAGETKDTVEVESNEPSTSEPSRAHFEAEPDTAALDQLVSDTSNLDIHEQEDENEDEDEDSGSESGHEERSNGHSNGKDPSSSSSSEEEEEDADGGGWITPKNVGRYKARDMGLAGKGVKEEEVKVAVITSDFAMQVSRRAEERGEPILLKLTLTNPRTSIHSSSVLRSSLAPLPPHSERPPPTQPPPLLHLWPPHPPHPHPHPPLPRMLPPLHRHGKEVLPEVWRQHTDEGELSG